jgi:hypothetical protein
LLRRVAAFGPEKQRAAGKQSVLRAGVTPDVGVTNHGRN